MVLQEALVTPLTVDCARIRQLLPDFHDGALEGEEARFVEAHLGAGCAGCNESLLNLRSALSALDTLSAHDLERLRGDLPLAPGPATLSPELDVRPLAGLIGFATAAVLLLLAGSAWWGPSASAPTADPPVLAQVTLPQPPPPLPVVGGVVGIEEDPALLIALGPTSSVAEDAVLAPLPLAEPEPVAAVVPAGDEPEAAAVEEEPAQPADADDPGPPDPPDPPPPPPAPAVESPPDAAVALLARLQVAKLGIAYEEVAFYFVRDPAGRDRLGRTRNPVLPSVREASPADPEVCVVRPPAGRSGWRLLVGELLDGPYGLRIAPASFGFRARTAFDVIPVSFAGLDPKARRAHPLLKAPAMLPSKPRHALLTGAQPGPVAVFLKLLNDPTLLELRGLQTQLARLEPEAKDLERRLRSRIRDTRGLRGVGITVNGRARSLDVFASSKALSEELPKLIRTALLEAELESEIVDPVEEIIEQPAKGFREVSATRSAHVTALALLPKAQRQAGRRVYRVQVAGSAAAVTLSGDELLHGVVIPKP
jgi:hypothetical protein